MFRIGKSIEAESRLMVASGRVRGGFVWNWEEMRVTANRYSISFGGDESVLKLKW